ncbi:oligosaccharide flippase family protein [Brumicola blandensis]|uniref:Oligosaccharide flippase family protein n=1 Tax=Brumicola blandensis TaxID=3075611 RepID=A0AAW8R1N0_9ALTE|nr:oligosaccharide flippase family protein [Alteromonas sp. W409]MDT0582634.1 oligosaccharide flippase family protein [Alteromonas sp. W409]
MSEAKKALTGSIILVFTKISQKLLGLVSTLVLARILLPEDFGIIAISLLVITFMTTIAESGGREYIIRKDAVDDDDINTFWTLNLCLKTGIVVLVLLLTPLIAQFYEDQRLIPIIPMLALMLPLGALVNPELVICQRNQNYAPLLKIDLIKKIFAITLSISAALYFKNYWALIVGHLSSNLVGLICSYVIFNYRPKLTLINIKQQWVFSQWMLARSILGYTRSQLDNFFVSKFFSASELGGYYISKYISNMPATDLIAPALDPLLASYSRTKHSIEELKHQITLTLMIVASTAIPFAAFVYFNSFEIVKLILGDSWLEYSSLFAALSLLVIPHTIGIIAGKIITSSGKVRILFFYDFISLLTMFFVLYLLRDFSLESFTLGKLFVELIMVSLLLIVATLHMYKRKLFFILLLFLTSSLGAFSVGKVLTLFTFHAPVFFELSFKFAIFAAIWCVFVFVIFKVFLKNNHAALHIKFLIGKAMTLLFSKLARFRKS